MRLRPPRTLRGRLALVAALITALWVFVLTVVFDVVLVSQLDAQAGDVLRARAEAEASTVAVSPSGDLTIRETTDDAALDAEVWVYQGTRVLEEPPRRAGLRPDVEALLDKGRQTHDVDDTRLYARPVLHQGRQVGTIVAAVALHPYANSARLVVGGSVVLGALLLGSVYPVTRVVVSRAMRPVADMGEQAARWSADDVTHRFGDAGRPEELARLSRDLDGLLDRLAAVLRHERRLSAEISHELRTPLSRIVAEVELLQAAPRRSTALDTGLEAVAAGAAQMEQILETLLATARSESTAPPGRCRVVDAVSDAVAAVTVPSGVVLDPSGVGTSDVAGVDGAVLERILVPLLQNATRHARTWVHLSTRTLADAVEVVVRDDGPGLGALADTAFEPGVRGAGDHDGAGLGLALARRLARAAGGDLRWVPGPDGAVFEVLLPRG